MERLSGERPGAARRARDGCRTANSSLLDVIPSSRHRSTWPPSATVDRRLRESRGRRQRPPVPAGRWWSSAAESAAPPRTGRSAT